MNCKYWSARETLRLHQKLFSECSYCKAGLRLIQAVGFPLSAPHTRTKIVFFVLENKKEKLYSFRLLCLCLQFRCTVLHCKDFFFYPHTLRYFLRLSVYIWFGESWWYISHPALNFDWTVCNLSYQSGSHPHSAATFEKDLFKVHLFQSGGKIAHLIIQILNGVLRKRVVAVKCWRWRQELKSAC